MKVHSCVDVGTLVVVVVVVVAPRRRKKTKNKTDRVCVSAHFYPETAQKSADHPLFKQTEKKELASCYKLS